MSDLIDRDLVLRYIRMNIPEEYGAKAYELIRKLPVKNEPEWIDCGELPETEKNVFICFGTANFKSVCVGHYEPSMKMWYEDHKFFASPIYDALCYCDIPDIPEKYRGEKE